VIVIDLLVIILAMKKKILLVTGRNAKQAVEDYAKKSKVPVRIHACRENVAALLSLNMILDELSNLDPNVNEISLIIVPGSVRGDVSVIQERLKIPCWKGPENLVDLPFVLDRISSGLEFSAEIPADELLEGELKKEIGKELGGAYKPKRYSLKIGKNVFLGSGIGHVIAEVPDTPLMSDNDIARIAKHYEESGAEIIDIGMVAGEDNSSKIVDIVDIVRKSTKLPIAIDSLQEKEILAAADSGVDLVLSLDLGNCNISKSIGIPAVIIPRDGRGRIPKNFKDRVGIIENLMGKVNAFIADPILEPPGLGLVNSLKTYIKFRARYPEVPMLMGVGNVTELMDVDSPGINALLALIASELNIDLLFTTEASRKTSGAVRELSTAAKMAYLAKVRKQAPKDLGIDLMVLKDKKEIPPVYQDEGIESVEVTKDRKLTLDDYKFMVYLDDERINVIYSGDKKLRFTGIRAKDLYKEIIARYLVRNPEHAAYLGKELGKAEMALRLGKNYVQDEDLF